MKRKTKIKRIEMELELFVVGIILMSIVGLSLVAYGQASTTESETQLETNFEWYDMPGVEDSEKYNLTPFKRHDASCIGALTEVLDVKTQPEKYPTDYIDFAHAGMVDNCLQQSMLPLDPDYRMHPYVKGYLKKEGCLEGLSDPEIHKLTSPDLASTRCLLD